MKTNKNQKLVTVMAPVGALIVPKNNVIPWAIKSISKELNKDKDYRRSWTANIAMAYKDNERWYKTKTGKRYLNHQDKHIIANNAAEYFLKLLTA